MLPAATNLDPRGGQVQRDAVPSSTIRGRARLILAACIGDPALREDHALTVQAVMDQMVVDFPLRATGPGTTASFDDTFRFGLQVLRQLDLPDLVQDIRAQIDWEDFASRRNFSWDAAWPVDKVQRLYFDAPSIMTCRP
jgi:hypothetical protein